MQFLVLLLVRACAAGPLDTRSLTESSTVSQGFFLASDFDNVAPPPGSLSLSGFTAWGGPGEAYASPSGGLGMDLKECIYDISYLLSTLYHLVERAMALARALKRALPRSCSRADACSRNDDDDFDMSTAYQTYGGGSPGGYFGGRGGGGEYNGWTFDSSVADTQDLRGRSIEELSKALTRTIVAINEVVDVLTSKGRKGGGGRGGYGGYSVSGFASELGARNGSAWFTLNARPADTPARPSPGDLALLAEQVDKQLALLGALEVLICDAKKECDYILALLYEVRARLAAPQPCTGCSPVNTAPPLGATVIYGTPVTVGTPVTGGQPTYVVGTPVGTQPPLAQVYCPPGYYIPVGAGYALVCPANYACAGGTVAPVPCPTGSAIGSARCNVATQPPVQTPPLQSVPGCPAGYYCPVGSVTAVLCPAGYACPANSAVPTACPAAQAPAAGSAACTSTVGTGTIGNVPCPAGYYCGPAMGIPVLCPAGFFCPANSFFPVGCPVGTASGIGASACASTANVGQSRVRILADPALALGGNYYGAALSSTTLPQLYAALAVAECALASSIKKIGILNAALQVVTCVEAPLFAELTPRRLTLTRRDALLPPPLQQFWVDDELGPDPDLPALPRLPRRVQRRHRVRQRRLRSPMHRLHGLPRLR